MKDDGVGRLVEADACERRTVELVMTNSYVCFFCDFLHIIRRKTFFDFLIFVVDNIIKS